MNILKTEYHYFAVLFVLLGTGCVGGMATVESRPSLDATLAQPVAPTGAAMTATPGVPQPSAQAVATQAPVSPSPTAGSDLPGATSGPDCLGAEINPIASAIAADYPFTSYAQVMTWFCNGAEFEDILSALMTEELTGAPAEESLQMLADGFTWEEVWQLIGLTE